jgi:dipeptidyl aminopeptidase/acylaminoacyl peptidase
VRSRHCANSVSCIVAAAIVTLASSVAGQAAETSSQQALPAKRVLNADDFYLMESVSDAQLSPDGQWIAYLVTTSDREADEEQTALWMVSWDGTQHVRLTAPAESTSSPRWSPDGRYLSFLGKSADAEHSQVMLLDRRGGEPRALTQVTDDITHYDWSPDGQRIVLAMEASGDAPADAKPETDKSKHEKPPKPIVIDATHFKKDVSEYLGSGHDGHLYLLDVASGAVSALTAGTAGNDALPTWSADGKRIAFVHSSENSELGPPWRNQALWLKVSYPFFHADRIHTPTLFMGGTRDFNVPVAGGEQMYQALRTLKVPTQLIVYPDQYHEFTRPSFIKDRLERQAAWFGKYLQP